MVAHGLPLSGFKAAYTMPSTKQSLSNEHNKVRNSCERAEEHSEGIWRVVEASAMRSAFRRERERECVREMRVIETYQQNIFDLLDLFEC